MYVLGATRQMVLEYLRSEQAYTMHKPARLRFTRNYTNVAKIDAQWHTDLAAMMEVVRENGGLK